MTPDKIVYTCRNLANFFFTRIGLADTYKSFTFQPCRYCYIYKWVCFTNKTTKKAHRYINNYSLAKLYLLRFIILNNFQNTRRTTRIIIFKQWLILILFFWVNYKFVVIDNWLCIVFFLLIVYYAVSYSLVTKMFKTKLFMNNDKLFYYLCLGWGYKENV